MRIFFRTVMLVLILLLAGCSTNAQTETASPATSTAAEVGSPNDDGVTALPEAKNECAECHKEKTALIENAEEIVEAAESESKGVG